jgi:hypothetical protein
MTHLRAVVALWSVGALVLALSFGAHISIGDAAPMQQAAPNWGLAAPAYPASATVTHWAPATNAEMQTVFGRFHRSSYDALRRLNDRGYLQIERWTKTTTSHGTRARHVLTWSYGISEYGTESDAASAVGDSIRRLQVMPSGGVYGRSVSFSEGGRLYLFLTFGERTLTGEIACSVKSTDAKAYTATLQQYCRAHVTALMPALTAAAIPTSTMTATATNTMTATPTASSTATATDTSTATSTPDPTATQTLSVSYAIN